MPSAVAAAAMPAQAPPSSNVVPLQMPVRAKPPPGCIGAEEISAVLGHLPAGASVRVCQGKTCMRAGSVQLLADLQQRDQAADIQVLCRPLLSLVLHE